MAIQVSSGEKNDILIASQSGKTIKEIAFSFGRDQSTISKILKDLRPTTALARATILAKASELVDRVLEKADVDQAIDILQRANIGVLEPLAKGGGGSGGNVGILVSVSPGSLPAVDAAVYTDGKRQLQSEAEVVDGRAIRVGSLNVGQFAGSAD